AAESAPSVPLGKLRDASRYVVTARHGLTPWLRGSVWSLHQRVARPTAANAIAARRQSPARGPPTSEATRRPVPDGCETAVGPQRLPHVQRESGTNRPE